MVHVLHFEVEISFNLNKSWDDILGSTGISYHPL